MTLEVVRRVHSAFPLRYVVFFGIPIALLSAYVTRCIAHSPPIHVCASTAIHPQTGMPEFSSPRATDKSPRLDDDDHPLFFMWGHSAFNRFLNDNERERN
jgi:hypothetical protein